MRAWTAFCTLAGLVGALGRNLQARRYARLRMRVVSCLQVRRPREAAEIAAMIGQPAPRVLAVLEELGRAGIVDMQEPPPPADRRYAGWYLMPGATA